MPREVVLQLPPSPEPPALEGPSLLTAAAAAIGLAPDALAEARLRRVSFDARPRARRWRLVVDVWMRDEVPPPPPATSPPTFAAPRAGAPRVVVVGSGPAGLFCALDCVAAGLHVTVLERGRDVQARRRALAATHRGLPIDPDSNYCFGEGGAGTYSDGKLYTRAGSRPAIRAVLETLVAHGAPPEILASLAPARRARTGCRAWCRRCARPCARSGAAVRFGMRVEAIETSARAGRRAVAAAIARDLDAGARERVPCDVVVLAAGHSALDGLRMAARAGARLEAKGFAMGVRIEHPQPLARRQAVRRPARRPHDLPAAFYELATQVDERGVYSFCMCPGGFVVPASTDPARVVVNGMSLSRRDSPFANAGVVVQLEPLDWCGSRGAAWGWETLTREPLPDRTGRRSALRRPTPARARGARGGAGRRRRTARPASAAIASWRREAGAAAPLPSSYRPGLVAADLACRAAARG